MLSYAPSSSFRMLTISISITLSRASLSHHVLLIVFWRSLKQMIRATARWIVAVMANLQRPRVFIASQEERYATSDPHLSSQLDGPIRQTFLMYSSGPSPTANSGLLNIRPKTINFFFGKNNCDRLRFSHDMSLLNRFKNWPDSLKFYAHFLSESFILT